MRYFRMRSWLWCDVGRFLQSWEVYKCTWRETLLFDGAMAYRMTKDGLAFGTTRDREQWAHSDRTRQYIRFQALAVTSGVGSGSMELAAPKVLYSIVTASSALSSEPGYAVQLLNRWGHKAFVIGDRSLREERRELIPAQEGSVAKDNSRVSNNKRVKQGKALTHPSSRWSLSWTCCDAPNLVCSFVQCGGCH